MTIGKSPEGNQKKLYAIGDIHGCYSALVQLLDTIYADMAGSRAKVVFLGDYTDRGPDSCRVLQHLIELKDKSDPIGIEYVFIRGNHDEMFMDYVTGRDSWTFWNNGGRQTKESYDREAGSDIDGLTLMKSHLPFVGSTKLVHRDGRFVFVHAGIDPQTAWDEQVENTCLWAREYNSYNGDYHDGVFVVHGHTPVEDVHRRKNQLNIDTGCCFGKHYSEYGKLTGVRLMANETMFDFKLFQTRQYPLGEVS